MHQCSTCASFLPVGSARCPECDGATPAASATIGVVGVVASVGFAVTLMACYGVPPAYRVEPPPTPNCPSATVDVDGDGACSDTDCDDNDPQIGACSQP